MDLYGASRSANEYDFYMNTQEATIWYSDRKSFNNDIEGLLSNIAFICDGDFESATKGEEAANYISPDRNTGTYEEELHFVSQNGEQLDVRLVRLGTGEDAAMKVILRRSYAE